LSHLNIDKWVANKLRFKNKHGGIAISTYTSGNELASTQKKFKIKRLYCPVPLKEAMSTSITASSWGKPSTLSYHFWKPNTCKRLLSTLDFSIHAKDLLSTLSFSLTCSFFFLSKL
jgi:hypothetical protein